MDMWEYLDAHPEEGYYFDRTMDELTAVVADKLIATVDFTRYGRIVDVGGGLGRLLGKILAAAPQAQGVLFDRADVIERAKADLAGRIEPVAGNFLEEAPPGGDLYLLKQVLCDWNDEHCHAILDSCYRAAPRGSTLLLIEVLRPDEVTSSPVHFFDLGLLLTLDGRIRTREEYRSLLESVGYRLGEVVTAAGGANSWSLLTAHKD
jgi:ubiquinone/menaquinone biosynthesis C-methylase UbiE